MTQRCLFTTSSRAIAAKDSHLLWAKSAGRCAYPACTNRCVDSFENAGNILIGEMAHVLAYSKKGPRSTGKPVANVDKYENLVLLCPYHHTIVDKAPDDFPPELLRQWKSELEERVGKAMDIPRFTTKRQLFEYANELLAQNKIIHAQFGPSSLTAQANPFSNVQQLWDAKKIEEIIPNNALVRAAFKRYSSLLNTRERKIAGMFQAHAIAFSASAEDRLDSVPMFPAEFARMLDQED